MAEEETENWRGKLEAVIEAGVEEVWEVTRDFVGVEKWAKSFVGRCEWDGEDGEKQKRRRIWSLDGNLVSVERLIHMDPETHTFSYGICHEPDPCPLLPGGGQGYVATVSLSPSYNLHGHQYCLVSWSYSIPPIPSSNPSDLDSVILHLYRTLLSDLSSFFASRSIPSLPTSSSTPPSDSLI